MNLQIDRLKQNIEYTEYKDKIKIALPIALIASIMLLLGFLSFNKFTVVGY